MAKTRNCVIEDTELAGIKQLVELAAERLADVVTRTPVLSSRQLDSMLDASVFLKAEMYQRTGSFKFRGAYNCLSTLPLPRTSGVVAHSSGNFGQAVALAGQILGMQVVVVMPSGAPQIKVDAVAGYGAEIVFCGRESKERAKVAASMQRTRGLTLIEPYDDYQVIGGQGTAALELISEVGTLDALVVPLGGGGLLAGSAVIAKSLCPDIRLVGVEPSAMPKTALSISRGEPATVPVRDTLMDGQIISRPGVLTYPIIFDLVDDVVTVEDGEALAAMRWLYERLKVVVEPSGASALAGLLSGKIEPKGRVGVILSGGNIGLEQMIRIYQPDCS